MHGDAVASGSRREPRLRARLLRILLPATVLLVAACVAAIVHEVGDLRNVRVERDRFAFAVRLSAVAHEAAKERGTSSGFLGSGGRRFASDLAERRREMDRATAALRGEMASFASPRLLDSSTSRALDAALNEMDRLQAMRARVDQLAVPAKDSFQFYTRLIDGLLRAVEGIARDCEDAGTLRSGVAYAAFLRGKELAGQERGSLNNTFSADAFDVEHHQRVLQILASQDAAFAAFRAYAPEAEVARFDALLAPERFRDTTSMRDVALARADRGHFGVDPARWWDAMTRKISVMKEVEDALAAAILDALEVRERDARRNLWVTALAISASVAAALAFSLGNARVILRTVGGEPLTVAAAARRVARGDLSDVAGARDAPEGSLLHASGSMVAALREIVARAQMTCRTLRDASQQLLGATREISLGAQDQARQLAASSGDMRSMTNAFREVSSSCDSVARSAADSAVAAGEAKQVVAESNARLAQIRDDSAQARRTLDGLTEDYADVEAAVSAIHTVAAEMRTLAATACVEAERLGEPGALLVATVREMQALAQQCRAAAQRSRRTSCEAVRQLRNVDDAMARAVAAVAEGVAEAAALSDRLELIEARTKETRKAMTSIAGTITEQAAGASRMSSRAAALGTVARTTLGAIDALVRQGDALHATANDLERMLSRFSIGEASAPGSAVAVGEPAQARAEAADRMRAAS